MCFLVPSSTFFSVFTLAKDGCTTTCMVMTPFGSSPKGVLHWPTVLLFSRILPAFINLTSFAAVGANFLSLGHSEMILSLSIATVEALEYRNGPMSVPSYNRNLSSTKSSSGICNPLISDYQIPPINRPITTAIGKPFSPSNSLLPENKKRRRIQRWIRSDGALEPILAPSFISGCGCRFIGIVYGVFP